MIARMIFGSKLLSSLLMSAIPRRTVVDFWRQGKEINIASHVRTYNAFRSIWNVLKKVLETLLGLFGHPKWCGARCVAPSFPPSLRPCSHLLFSQVTTLYTDTDKQWQRSKYSWYTTPIWIASVRPIFRPFSTLVWLSTHNSGTAGLDQLTNLALRGDEKYALVQNRSDNR